MDYGTAQSATFENRVGCNQFTNKGIAIKIGSEDHPVAIIFDTELQRYSVAWTYEGEFLNLTGVGFNGQHGPMPTPKGNLLWSVNGQHPGASISTDFNDPRKEPYGPLPHDDTWGHYKGMFKYGPQVVLNYEIAGCNILEMPTAQASGDDVTIGRRIQVGPCDKTINLVVAEDDAEPQASKEATTAPTTQPLHEHLIDQSKSRAKLDSANGRTFLSIPPHKNTERMVVEIFRGDSSAQLKWPNEDLTKYCKGGPANWPQTVTTHGTLGTGDGPYVVDTITAPEDNPYKSWLRFSGFDFFSDGRAAICTWSGDVWVVSGIDGDLKNLVWKRYATGLFQTLGLRIVKDQVYVLGRDQITRLHDLNNDGEADWYENFNNDCAVAQSFHEFALDLQSDSKGNFYYAKGGAVNPGGRGFQRVTADNGTIIQISPDGKKKTTYATGLRAPNGMSCGPHDELTVSDNQGTWVPACRINFVYKGSFEGVPDNAHMDPKPTQFGDPICWFPYPDVDNSSGGGVWDTTDKWGPFKDKLLTLSYGTCSLFELMYEKVDGMDQGGVVRFPLDFITGICRARVNPVDGQIYVAGLKGWQTSAAKDCGFQRVRYTGKTVNMPNELHVKENGIEIGFTTPIDPKSAGDPDSYDVEQWNYVWAEDYGSPEVHVGDPKQKGRETVNVKQAIVSADKKHVLLVMTDIQPVMQMKIKMKIDAADGSPVECEIDNSINRVPNYKPHAAASQPTASAK